MATETDWRTIHRRLNTDMIYAEDLGGRSRIDVEIVDSGITKLRQRSGPPKEMPWLAFKGAKKRLGLGATMCKTMTTMTGTRIVERWRGWITLIVIKTTYRDQDTGQVETTDAIRIAPKRPRPHADDRPVLDELPPPADTAPESPSEPTFAELSEEDKRAIALADAEEARGK